ncbi:MAG: adenine deaminase [Thermoplasmata archaeon]
MRGGKVEAVEVGLIIFKNLFTGPFYSETGPVSYLKLKGKVVDVLNENIFEGVVSVEDGRIVDIQRKKNDRNRYIMPGFVDSHVHVESSMLSPTEFSRVVVQHGTVAAVCDPHEIANVLGLDGIRFMIKEGNRAPLKFNFGAPTCVPATPFETNGAELGPEKLKELLETEEISHLSEVMDFTGVINGKEELLEKIELAREYCLKIDGHAPGLRGEELSKYISAGIETDHESTSLENAREKVEKGMKIQIREGSASRDFDELVDLIDDFPGECMFCTDDIKVNDLIDRHIDAMVGEAVKRDIDLMKVLKTACVNPVLHYDLDVGLLREGDPADFIVVDDLENLKVERSYIDGEEVYSRSEVSRKSDTVKSTPNNFRVERKRSDDFRVKKKEGKLRVIGVNDENILTEEIIERAKNEEGHVVADKERDILKLAVLNRYEESEPAVGFVQNFGLEEGAIASSVLHDSHNLAAVGTDDRAICEAMNAVIEEKGGLSAVSNGEKKILPLPIAGLMSDRGYEEVEKKFEELKEIVDNMGCDLTSPYMTLSFMALLVIPNLKLSDKGLFDVKKSEFVDIFV